MTEEHSDWVRYNSFREARKINPKKDVDGLLEDARKISSYVLEIPKCELKEIKTIKKKK